MIDALFFDGQSTRGNPVTLVVQNRLISMRGEGIHRSARLSEVQVSERFGSAPRILRFADGATIEITDRHFDELLRENQQRESIIVSWQQSWAYTLLALVTLLVILLGGYRWGVPWAADMVAHRLPVSVEKELGDQGLKLLDEHFMEPSKLSVVEQGRLRNLFAHMKQPHGEKTAYTLEFRRSKIGPNALALPNGVIIMTDELVKMAGNDHAVLGVLGHELGHVRHRHVTRRMLQSASVGIVTYMLFGDISSVLSTLPAFVLDQKYSRDFERESDQYAIDMMRVNRMPLSPMADFFVKLENMDFDEGQEGDVANRKKDHSEVPQEQHEGLVYLSSHPANKERIEKLRAADKGI
jgi:Zn-dependent protease with chaperone function